MKNKKLLKILTIITGTLFLIVIIFFFFSYLLIPSTIKSYYTDNTPLEFPSTWETVLNDDTFLDQVEIKKISFDWKKAKYTAFYDIEGYEGYDNASIGDFFYLERKNLLFWEVIRYETSYRPYIINDDQTFEESYDSFKNDILSGEIENGLTPDEQYLLQNEAGDSYPDTGEFLDYIQSPSGDKTVEVLSNGDFGTNYLVLGETGEELGIENLLKGIWSTDEQYFIYSTGEIDPIFGGLVPNLDILITDLNDKPQQIFELDEKINDLGFYSDGSLIIYSTKNTVGVIDMNGDNNRIIYEYIQPIGGSEEFALAEVQIIEGSQVYLKVPSVDYFENGVVEDVVVGLY